jgi:hypothetical protein
MIVVYSEIIKNLDDLNDIFHSMYERFKGGLRVEQEQEQEQKQEQTHDVVAKITLFRTADCDKDNNYNLVFKIRRDGTIFSNSSVYKDSFKLKWSILIQIWLENSVYPDE